MVGGMMGNPKFVSGGALDDTAVTAAMLAKYYQPFATFGVSVLLVEEAMVVRVRDCGVEAKHSSVGRRILANR